MDVIAALCIAVSLAADAMTVAICCGMKSRKNERNTALLTGVMFGSFQIIMTVLGWSIGKVGLQIFSGENNAFAFLVLVLLGIKMLYDSRKKTPVSIAAVTLKEMVLLSVATSVDALALGTVLPMAVRASTTGDLIMSVFIIGIVTFILSYSGFRLGNRFVRFRPETACAAGGIVLIILAVKTLII